MSYFTICYDPRVLITRLKRCEPFKIYLGAGAALKPEYKPQSLYREGDIVVFAFTDNYTPFFIGKIERVQSLRGVMWYYIACIQRTQAHIADLKMDEERRIVKHINTMHKDIICELVPWE